MDEMDEMDEMDGMDGMDGSGSLRCREGRVQCWKHKGAP